MAKYVMILQIHINQAIKYKKHQDRFKVLEDHSTQIKKF
jgi:hypothetical protein